MSTDHEALQGFWKFTAVTFHATPSTHCDLGTLFQFIGNRFQHIRTRVSYRFELHPDTTPKGIDFILDSCRVTVHGLYAIEGDTLRLIRAHDWGLPRPTSFEEPNHTVDIYTRFKRRVPIQREVKALRPQTVIPGGFIPKGLLDNILVKQKPKVRKARRVDKKPKIK